MIFSLRFLIGPLFALFICSESFGQGLEVGKVPPILRLEGEIGARVSGQPWSSEELKGNLFCLFYIDPEEKKHNEPVEVAFKKEQFPKEKLKSVAIVNMAAAWYPNSMIASQLEAKQKEFPDTVYAKDFKKELVKTWQLQDDNVNVALINREGVVIFLKKGPMNAGEIQELMDTVRKNL
jgi:predicted transcriptional regulator